METPIHKKEIPSPI